MFIRENPCPENFEVMFQKLDQVEERFQEIEQLEEIAIYRVDGSVAFHDYKTLEFVNEYQDRIVFPRTERVERVDIQTPEFREVLATNAPVIVESVEKRE